MQTTLWMSDLQFVDGNLISTSKIAYKEWLVAINSFYKFFPLFVTSFLGHTMFIYKWNFFSDFLFARAQNYFHIDAVSAVSHLPSSGRLFILTDSIVAWGRLTLPVSRPGSYAGTSLALGWCQTCWRVISLFVDLVSHFNIWLVVLGWHLVCSGC